MNLACRLVKGKKKSEIEVEASRGYIDRCMIGAIARTYRAQPWAGIGPCWIVQE
jgi:hypothetical protein